MVGNPIPNKEIHSLIFRFVSQLYLTKVYCC